MNVSSLTQFPVVPVLVVAEVGAAHPLATALVAGGLPIAEVTMRTPDALGVIRGMADVAGLTVGAGTVLSVDHARKAMDAGAAFLVSPGFDQDTIAYARDAGTPILPGVATATEIQRAANAGLKLLKFFPAGVNGGAPALKAYGSVFGDIQFVPTGGVNEGNLGDYLGLGNVPAVGGSWIAPGADIAAGNFDKIAATAASALTLAKTIQG